MKTKHFPAVVIVVLCVISCAMAILDYFLPAMGDDLSFWAYLGLEDYTVPNRKTLSFILAHIVGCNGRIFDYMGPVVINLLPRFLAAIVMGAMGGLFFYSVILAAGLKRARHITLTIAALLATLCLTPWWDSMWLRVCQFNYTWGTAFCLLTVYLFFNYDSPRKPLTVKSPVFYLLVLLGICAGGTHEQTGVAMSFAFVLWALPGKRYRSLSLTQKALAYGLIIGTLMVIGAPAIWHRAAAGSTHFPLGYIILTSVPVYVALVAVLAATALTAKGRKFLSNFITADRFIYLTAGFASAVIALASGVPGRTGLFSEMCALVMILQFAQTVRLRINRPVAAALCSLMLGLMGVHFFVAIKQTSEAYDEYEEMLAAYCQSTDGIVFMDYGKRNETSPWVLSRVKGVPDDDDWYNRLVIERTYSNETKPLNILPTKLRGFEERLDTAPLTSGEFTILTTEPALRGETPEGVTIAEIPGIGERVVRHARLASGREIWIAGPWIVDPGDFATLISKQ